MSNSNNAATVVAVDDTALLNNAKGFIAAGFACHPLRPRQKIPIEAGWQNGPAKTFEEFCASHHPGCNLGFCPGLPSTRNGYSLIVIDVDIRSDDPRHSTEARQAVIELFGEDRAPNVITGGGGQHYYIWCLLVDVPSKASTILACSQEMIGSKRAWQIELLSTGKNCVLPSSIGPSGKPYLWVNNDIIIGLPDGVRAVLAKSNIPKRGFQKNAFTMGSVASSPPLETPENIVRLREALGYIPACIERPEWLKVLFSINAHGWQCGETIAYEWSATCPEKFSAEEFSKAWNSDKAMLRKVAE